MEKIIEDTIKKAVNNALKESLAIPFNLYSEDFMDIEKRKYAHAVIQESAHAFEGQYELAQKCAEETIINIQKKLTEFRVDTEDANIPYIEITISTSIVRGGAIDGLFDDGGIHLTLRLLNSDVTYVPEDLEAFLKTVITHELMHGYIFLKRFEKEQDVNPAPSYYSEIVSIMRESVDNDIYYFCRGLYLSYFHETQAFVSQSWVQTEKILNNYPSLYNDKKRFIEAFKKTNIVDDFLTTSFWCNRIANDIKLCEYVSKALSEYGMCMTAKNILKNAKNIVKKIESAIIKALNNAYINWQDSIKNN